MRRDPMDIKFKKDEIRYKKLKIAATRQISQLNQNLQKILRPISLKQHIKISPKIFCEIILAPQQVYYFQLVCNKQNPPLKLYIKKMTKDTNLLIYFSKNNLYPDYENNDFKYDELENEDNINCSPRSQQMMKITLNDERIGQYLQDCFYLAIVSNSQAKIQLAYSFSTQQLRAPHQQANILTINTNNLTNITTTNSKPQSTENDIFRSTMPNIMDGYKTHRIIPKHKKGYLEMKKSVNEMISDYQVYKVFQDQLNNHQGEVPQRNVQEPKLHLMIFLEPSRIHKSLQMNRSQKIEEAKVKRDKKQSALFFAAVLIQRRLFKNLKIKYENKYIDVVKFQKAGVKLLDIKISIFKKFYHKIESIQERFRNHIKIMDIRRKILKDLWNQELQQMIFALVQRSKPKKNQALLEKLQTLDSNIRENILNKYFTKCYIQYNAAFFKWHEMSVQHSKDNKHVKFLQILQHMTDQENGMIDTNLEQEALNEFNEMFSNNTPTKENGFSSQETLRKQVSKFSGKQKIDNLDIIDFKMHTFIPEDSGSKSSKRSQEFRQNNGAMITEVDFDKLQENILLQKQIKGNNSNKSTAKKLQKKSSQSVVELKGVETKQTQQQYIHNQIQKLHGNNTNNNDNQLKLYEDQLKDLTKAPQLIYLPSKILMQRMILRACFIKSSMTLKFGYKPKIRHDDFDD
ncbi:UNKNOWN [Stylonychia lemnae]|uniref:Uncharacterized protein n=1 Tax=Stylonychia lemnae TaxID=5949 RepID=A0A078AFF9_STYLE|nr:UNKNOWN [Stylonychia lemnae]|eukprot:CDW80915.1 UNKNOWN [Stylonychia lemnae]